MGSKLFETDSEALLDDIHEELMSVNQMLKALFVLLASMATRSTSNEVLKNALKDFDTRDAIYEKDVYQIIDAFKKEKK